MLQNLLRLQASVSVLKISSPLFLPLPLPPQNKVNLILAHTIKAWHSFKPIEICSFPESTRYTINFPTVLNEGANFWSTYPLLGKTWHCNSQILLSAVSHILSDRIPSLSLGHLIRSFFYVFAFILAIHPFMKRNSNRIPTISQHGHTERKCFAYIQHIYVYFISLIHAFCHLPLLHCK